MSSIYKNKHLLNTNYNITDYSKFSNFNKNTSRNQTNRSNFAITKNDVSFYHNKNHKNVSLLFSVLSKNKQTTRLNNLVANEIGLNFIEPKNNQIKSKKSHEIFCSPVLNIPDPSNKNKNMLMNQNNQNNFMENNNKKEIIEKQTNQKSMLKIYSHDLVVLPILSSIKNAENSQNDDKKTNQNYFFNLKSLKRIKSNDKNMCQSNKNEIKSVLNNDQSNLELKKNNIESEKIKIINFIQKFNIESECQMNFIQKKQKSSNKRHEIPEKNQDIFTKRSHDDFQNQPIIIPKFQKIYQSLFSEKEIGEIKNLKLLIQSQFKDTKTLPETDMRF